MPLVDGLQSAVMYRTGKLVNGCATVFVLYPLIIYVVSSTLLLATEGANASPSQRDIKEAEKTVGQFLRSEAGTAWLAGLAKTRSVPLTTEDIINQILEASRPEGQIWKAASILSQSFKDQTLKGIKTDSILDPAENWKDLITHIENQEDIICLYRKNTEETEKKADDWKKFLRSVSPGYTVHLAIDTGRKYIICLKKINVQETTSGEILTMQGTQSTLASIVDPPLVSTTMTFATTPEQLKIIPTSGIMTNINNTESTVKPDNSDKKCDNKDSKSIGNREDEVSNNNDDADDENIEDKAYVKKYSSELEYNTIKPMREMEDDLSEEFVDHQINSVRDWRRRLPPSFKEREFYLNNNRMPLNDYPPRIPEKLNPSSVKNTECNRPIILVVSNDNTPSRYQQDTSWFPSHPVPFPQMPQPSTLQLIPQPPVHVPNIPRPPFNPFMVSNDFPRLTNLNNLAKPNIYHTTVHSAGPKPIFSQNTNSVYKISRGIPIAQTFQNAFVPQPLNIKSRGSELVRQKSYSVKNLTNSFGNYIPRNIERPLRPSILNLLNRKSSGITQQNVSTRNVVLPRRGISDKVNPVDDSLQLQLAQRRNAYHLRQFLQNYKSYQVSTRAPILAFKSQSIAQKPVQLLVGQPPSPLINVKTSAHSFPVVDRELLGKSLPRPSQYINQNNPQLINLVRQNRPVHNFYQTPCSNFNQNDPMTNNLQPNVLPPTRFKSPSFTGPCPIPWNILYATGNNNPRALNSLAHPTVRCSNSLICPLAEYQLQGNSIPCPSPCDRPLKLQIIINGKVHEPLKVSVIREPGQRIEIIGSGNQMMPYGSRNMRGRGPLMRNLGDEEKNIQSTVSEVKERMNELKENTQEDVDDKQENEETEVEKQKEMDEDVTSVGSTLDQSEKLNNQHNSTTESRTQTTDVPEIKRRDGQKIGEKFVDEKTIESSSKDSAIEANTTMFAITNSTVFE